MFKINQRAIYKASDEVEINYYYKNNNKKRLLIIFQGNGQMNTIIKNFNNFQEKNNYLSEDYLNEYYNISGKYNYFNTFDKYSDLLIIEDNFLAKKERKKESIQIFWYYKANEEFLSEYIIDFIKKIKHEFKYRTDETDMMGSSKGGFAVLSLLKYQNHFNKIFCMYPVASAYGRIRDNNIKKLYSKNISKKKDPGDCYKEIIEYINCLSVNGNEKIYIFLGISDDDTSIFLNPNFLTCNIYLDTRIKKHKEYVVFCDKLIKKYLFKDSEYQKINFWRKIK